MLSVWFVSLLWIFTMMKYICCLKRLLIDVCLWCIHSNLIWTSQHFWSTEVNEACKHRTTFIDVSVSLTCMKSNSIHHRHVNVNEIGLKTLQQNSYMSSFSRDIELPICFFSLISLATGWCHVVGREKEKRQICSFTCQYLSPNFLLLVTVSFSALTYVCQIFRSVIQHATEIFGRG